MLLKSLELNGFKSFAHKTVVEFQSGITAIVGPNGSGKSNIIDALRWLLGEREAKHLRGEKTEDLIFAGTSTRSRASMGHASINLENTKKQADFAEITIARQVSRAGASKYFLNKSEVRVKDVVDFLAKSRLGVRGIIIVDQGNSDLFVRATPSERKEMIEEILGLKEYRLKKTEAERKLKATIENIGHISARIDELAPRIRLLHRQVEKQKRRNEIEHQLNQMESIIARQKHSALQGAIAGLTQENGVLSQKIAPCKTEINRLEKALAAVHQPSRNDIDALRAQQNKLLAQRSELEKQQGKIEYQIETYAKRRKEELHPVHASVLVNLVKDIRAQLNKVLAQTDANNYSRIIKTLIRNIDEILGAKPKQSEKQDALQTIRKIHEALFSKIKECNITLATLQGQDGELTAQFEAFNATFSKTFSQLERTKVEVREHEARAISLAAKKAELMNEAQRIEGGVVLLAHQPQTPLIPLGEAEQGAERIRIELAAIGEIDAELVTEYNETEERYTFLTTQKSDLESAAQDLLTLAKELERKIHGEFSAALKNINKELHSFVRTMFGGGTAQLSSASPRVRENDEDGEEAHMAAGVDIAVSLPGKRITGLDMLSGGERSLVSIAALFSLISISPPPFLVFDEIDAALDEQNARRFANLLKEFSAKTQFIVVTHNRATMEVAHALYGVTINNGISQLVSLKLK